MTNERGGKIYRNHHETDSSALRKSRHEAPTAPHGENHIKPSSAAQFGAGILIVDDDPINQEIAYRMLRKLGCTAEAVANGQIALERFANRKFDLILMDCEMPVMDGFTAVEQIRDLESRASPAQRAIPIVASTARPWIEVRERCENVGMNDFVVKPFDIIQLAETLKRWLNITSNAIAAVADQSFPASTSLVTTALDPAALDAIRKIGGDTGVSLVARVIGQYHDNARRAAATIRACLESDDADGAWRAAHKLKSSSGTLGAHRLWAHCQEIERRARDQGSEAAKPLLARLDAEISLVLAELTPLGPTGHSL